MGDSSTRSAIPEQSARFRQTAPAGKEERHAEQELWWLAPGATAPNRGTKAGQLTSPTQKGSTAGISGDVAPPATKQAVPSHSASAFAGGRAAALKASSADGPAPSVDVLQQLIARNPALLQALTDIERDENGRISGATLERIREALDSQALTPQQVHQQAQQRVEAFQRQMMARLASEASPSTVSGPAHSAALSHVSVVANRYLGVAADVTHHMAAQQAAAAEQAARTAAAAVAAAAFIAHTPASPRSSSSSSRVPLPLAAGSLVSSTVDTGANQTVTSQQRVVTTDDTQQSPVTAASAPASQLSSSGTPAGTTPGSHPVPEPDRSLSPNISSTGARAGTTDGSTSGGNSGVSSRMASMRQSMSLSIDVSQRPSDSSSDSANGRRTSSDPDSNTDNRPVTSTEDQEPPAVSSKEKPQDSSKQAGQQQVQIATALPAGAIRGSPSHSSNGGSGDGKHRHPSTPGFALHRRNSEFEEGSGNEDESAANSMQQGQRKQHSQQQLKEQEDQADNQLRQENVRKQQWGQKLSKRPATPGVSLGKPVSIFSHSGNTETDERHTPAAAAATAAAADAKQQQWGHKLSKRPPTPGAGLGKPVSIFSSSGATQQEGVSPATSSPSRPVSAPGRSRPAHEDEVFEHEHVVQFAEPSSELGQRSTGKSRRNTWEAASSDKRQKWGHKLSKRPPTPGDALGLPVSIFSNRDPGSTSPEQHGAAVSGDDSESEGERVVRFKQQGSASSVSTGRNRAGARPVSAPGYNSATAQGDDNGTHVRFKEPRPRVQFNRALVQPGKVSATDTAAVRKHTEQQWGHKLSKRPPTPATGLGQPVSIFSDSGSKHRYQQQPEVTFLNDDDDSSGSEFDDPAKHVIRFSDADAVIPSTDEVVTPGGAAAVHREQPGTDSTAASKKSQQWHHKLSHRPPTPGDSLAKPISIFSSDGSSSRQQQQQQVPALTPPTAEGGSPARRVSFSEMPPGLSLQHHADASSSGGAGEVCRVSSCDGPVKHTSAGQQHLENAPIYREQVVSRDSSPVQKVQQSQHKSGKDIRRVSFEQPALTTASIHPATHQPDPQENAVSTDNSPQHSRQQQLQQELPAGMRRNPSPVSIVIDDETDHAMQDRQQQQQQIQQQPRPGAASAVTSRVSQGQVNLVERRPSLQQALLEHNPDLALDKQQQYDKQRVKAATTPGAGLGTPFSVFKEDAGSPQRQRPDREGPPAAAVVGSPPGRRGSLQQALLQRNPELALDQQQQQDHKQQKAATTPGAGLSTTYNMFKDDNSGHKQRVASPAVANGSPISSRSRSSLLQQALLLHNPDLALEQQQQQDHKQQKAATTPGAGLGRPFNMFRDDDSGHKQPVASPAVATGSPISSRSRSSSLQQALLLHNPDLALEQQQQQDHKQQKAATTPGAGLGRPFNMFRDDSDDTKQLPAAPSAAVSVSAGGKASRSNSLQQLLLQSNPDLALDEQQQQDHRQQKSATTPGAGLGRPFSIFGDDSKNTKQPAAVPEAAVSIPVGGRASRSNSLQQLLLQSNPDLALEKQQQLERQQGKAPTTPGASTGQPFSVFKDASYSPVEAVTVASAASPATAHGRASRSSSFKEALMQLNPDLAVEMQQQWEQKQAKVPTTPGGASGEAFSMLKDNSVARQPEQKVQSSSVNRHASSAASPAAHGGRASRSSSLKEALLQLIPDLALQKQQQWEQKQSKAPTTPGASLTPAFSIFKDASGSRQTEQTQQAARPGSAAASSSGSSRTARSSSLKDALLQHNSDLALEKQQQWEQKQAKVPTTPGAGLGQHFNMFRDDDEQEEQKQQSLAGAPVAGAAAPPNSIRSRSNSLQDALLQHNSDLALEKQQQWERKQTKVPTTPGAGLGAQVSIFKDDPEAKNSNLASPVQSANPASSPVASPAAAGSPRTSRLGLSSSPKPSEAHGASPGRAQSPDLMGAARHGQQNNNHGPNDGGLDSSNRASRPRSRSASRSRHSSTSPLRIVTTAADAANVAAFEADVRRSPLRRSSNTYDPDPAKLSPLGHSRGSKDGSSQSRRRHSDGGLSSSAHIASPNAAAAAAAGAGPSTDAVHEAAFAPDAQPSCLRRSGKSTDPDPAASVPLDYSRGNSSNSSSCRRHSDSGPTTGPLSPADDAAYEAGLEADRNPSRLRRSSKSFDPDPARLSPLRQGSSSSTGGSPSLRRRSDSGAVSSIVLTSPGASESAAASFAEGVLDDESKRSRLHRSSKSFDPDPAVFSPLGNSRGGSISAGGMFSPPRHHLDGGVSSSYASSVPTVVSPAARKPSAELVTTIPLAVSITSPSGSTPGRSSTLQRSSVSADAQPPAAASPQHASPSRLSRGGSTTTDIEPSLTSSPSPLSRNSHSGLGASASGHGYAAGADSGAPNSPLRHASTAADPAPGRGSPLRRNSASFGNVI